jgi:hypothetical protein
MKFIHEYPDSELPSTGNETVDYIYQVLRAEFIGYESIDAKKELENTLIHKFFNLKICEMCQIDPFICEFEEYYYDIHQTKRIEYNLLSLFYNKLPRGLGIKMQNFFLGLENTLGARITTLRQWITEQCIEKITLKEAQIKLCCNQLQERVGNYGCNRPKGRRKKKIFRKIDRSEYRRKNKFPKKFNKQKYFRRKKKYPKKNSCPKGKKTCTCWLCHEEGHYANECPKKKNSKKETLKLIWEVGFEPIESDIDSDESSIFEYTTEEEFEE